MTIRKLRHKKDVRPSPKRDISIAYGEDCLKAAIRPLERAGFQVSNCRIYRDNFDFRTIVSADIHLGVKEVGKINGSVAIYGNGNGCSFSFDFCYHHENYQNSFSEYKYTQCIKGRPKIRRWAAYATKKLKEYWSKESMTEIRDVMES